MTPEQIARLTALVAAQPPGKRVQFHPYEAALIAEYAEIARLRDALAQIAVMGRAESPAVAERIAAIAVDTARAALRATP